MCKPSEVHLAVADEDLTIFARLKAQGFDLDAEDDDGNTPLNLAAMHGTAETIRALLELGVDINHQNIGACATPLWQTVDTDYFDGVKLLVEYGADINCEEAYGRTPLLRAAQIGSLEMVKYLLDHGADHHTVDISGNGIVFYAIRNPDLDVLRYLIDIGANLNTHEKDEGHTPLDYAISMKIEPAIEILKAHNAQPGEKMANIEP